MRAVAFLLLLVLSLGAPAAASAAKSPIVVELFTAQGCSSCGKMVVAVNKLADEPGLIVLTWPVDYWDYLGWKDTFAKPEFTDRQRAYDKTLGLRDVYTPQVIVDGRLQASGATVGAVEALIREARVERADPPDMAFVGTDRVAVGSAPRPRGGAEVWLVRYSPKTSDVEVTAGDNRGQTVVERNVVRQVERLGAWSGRPVLLKMPPASDEGLATVIIVQGSDGGPIVGVLGQQSEEAPRPAQ
jgi:hypothetical protein